MLNTVMAKINVRSWLNWAGIVVWLAVIFYFSSLKGGGVANYSVLYFLERKSLHVIEYFILTSLLYRALIQNFSQAKVFILAGALSLLYAMTDEWHQTFVPGREGLVRDVLIDLMGIVLAIIFIWSFKQWMSRKKQ
ncbi:hypothetical protein EPO05_03975 [Patescibacteria group bacterium]|nr:MAG: hypothetical protein EPO05_03975 [Patescibacteria group bacterium]